MHISPYCTVTNFMYITYIRKKKKLFMNKDKRNIVASTSIIMGMTDSENCVILYIPLTMDVHSTFVSLPPHFIYMIYILHVYLYIDKRRNI